MRALVFGGSGFIGSALIKELIANRHCVINFDLKPNKHFDDEAKKLVRYKFIQGNIIEAFPDSLVSMATPEVVYVLSAMSDIGDCSGDPHRAFSTNVMGLINILDYIANLRFKEGLRIEKNSFGKVVLPKVVFASSVYAASAEHPYGMTKMVGEGLVKWYAYKFKIPYLILRFGTVYGPGAGKGNSIRKLIKMSFKGGRVVHYGTGEELREYVHVRDVARSCVDLSINDNVTMVISGLTTMDSRTLCGMVNEMLFPLGSTVHFEHERPEDHYVKTPYRYVRDEVMKHVPRESVDFGAGLMEVIEEVKRDEN